MSKIINGKFTIFYIKKNLIGSLPNGIQMINHISKMLNINCNWSIGDLSDDTTSALCFYKESNDEIDLLSANLSGYFEIKQNSSSEYEGTSELYNVCRFKTVHSNGKRFIEYFIRMFLNYFKTTNPKQRTIWLGVALDTKSHIIARNSIETKTDIVTIDSYRFLSNVKLYARLGFNNPVLANRSLYKKNIGFPIIDMRLEFDELQGNINNLMTDNDDYANTNYTKKIDINYIHENEFGSSDSIDVLINNNPIVPQYIITEVTIKAVQLRNDYISAEKKGVIYIYLGMGLCQRLYEYLRKDREVGGPLYVSTYINNPIDPNLQCVQVGIKENEIIEATDAHLCNVIYYPTTPWAFHTHPYTCYSKANSISGWPSGLDYDSYVSFYNVYLNFVPAAEGIFIVHLTPEFKNYLSLSNESTKTLLKKGINSYMVKMEMHRIAPENKEYEYNFIKNNLIDIPIIVKTISDPSYQQLIYDYINIINNLFLHEVSNEINNISTFDCIMFNITLQSWEYIKHNNGIYYKTLYKYPNDLSKLKPVIDIII
jgi:hypothetical protein